MATVAHPTSLGGSAFSHTRAASAEAEYDRLRALARTSASARSSCMARSQAAYASGDGAGAKALSEEGRRHGAEAERWDRAAAEFIFAENNAGGRVAEDAIDLHGLYVEEAERAVEERIRAARGRGEGHLHVIVGKGNHSANHVQKIKPAVERVCQELGLQYRTEPNEGVLYVNLQGGPAVIQQGQQYGGTHGGQAHGAYQGQQQGHGQYQQQPQHQQQHQQHQQQQQEGGNDEIEKLALKLLPRLLTKLEKACCVMM